MSDVRGLIVLAFGGPHRREDIRPFLHHVLTGRSVPEARFESVVAHYELLGGCSPITEHTVRQASLLSAELAARGTPLDVRVGMRHWSPWLKDTLADFGEAGIGHVIALIMAAQETEASTARYVQAVEAARKAIGEGAPRVSYVNGWGLSTGVIEAHACHLSQTLGQFDLPSRTAARVLFSAHSIPVAMAVGSPYVNQLEQTAALVAQKVGLTGYGLVYQSRSGNPGDVWLEPDVLDALDAAAAAGIRDVVVTPIGFLCDHVEVLFDLDIEARKRATALGIRLHRVPTLGCHPAFIRALASAVEASLPVPL